MLFKKVVGDYILPLIEEHYFFSDFKVQIKDEFIKLCIPKNTIKVTTKEFNFELDKIPKDILKKVDDTSVSYILYLNRQNVIDDYLKQDSVLIEKSNNEQVVTIDMSSPNIGKPMSYQHFRSTIIGNIITNTYEKKGYKIVKINHIGDWGLPLSGIILAIHKWGSFEAIEENPSKELDKLYQLYIKNFQLNPYLEEETLQIFKQLTLKKGKVFDTWLWLKDLSLKLFTQIYDTFGITFDSIKGESFYLDYNDKMINLMKKHNKVIEKNHSLYLKIDGQDILIQDIDGYSTYLTRDLAAAYYRYNKYKFDKSIYVIGKEQSEHFTKLKYILKELDFNWYHSIEHIGYSPVMIKTDHEKQSYEKRTDILDIINIFTKSIEQKLEVSENIAKKLAVNYLVFEMSNHYRDEIITINIDKLDELIDTPVFHLTKLLNILKKYKLNKTGDDIINSSDYSDEFVKLVWHLSGYKITVEQFLTNFDSIVLIRYLESLCEITHKYIYSEYLSDRIELNPSDYQLVQSVIRVIEESFELMGLNTIVHF